MSFVGKRIWIIGASSGIGEALAQNLAAQGAILALSARNGEALHSLKDSLERRSLSFDHQVIPLNVADLGAVQQAVEEVKSLFGEIDSILFLAALYQPMDLHRLDMDSVRQMVEINLLGAFNVVHSVVPLLRRQKRGQLALCSSVAGYVGLPHAQPYSATKAAIRSLAQSLRTEMRDFPAVDIKLISPGFVKTSLTDKNPFPMPMMISPRQAAESLADGLRSSGFEVHFPKRFTLLMKGLEILPYPLYFYCMRKFIKA